MQGLSRTSLKNPYDFKRVFRKHQPGEKQIITLGSQAVHITVEFVMRSFEVHVVSKEEDNSLLCFFPFFFDGSSF